MAPAEDEGGWMREERGGKEPSACSSMAGGQRLAWSPSPLWCPGLACCHHQRVLSEPGRPAARAASHVSGSAIPVETDSQVRNGSQRPRCSVQNICLNNPGLQSAARSQKRHCLQSPFSADQHSPLFQLSSRLISFTA